MLKKTIHKGRYGSFLFYRIHVVFQNDEIINKLLNAIYIYCAINAIYCYIQMI